MIGRIATGRQLFPLVLKYTDIGSYALIAVLVIYLVFGQIHSPLGLEINPFFAVWAAMKQGWPGILMQLVLIPAVFWIAGKFTLKKQAE